MIKVDSITKNFDSKVVLDNISFEAKPGEVFGLLGPNGAGKTTLIRMLLDIIRPDSGEILIDSRKITPSVKDLIGYLPEERGLYRNQKIIDVLVYLGMLKNVPRDIAREKAEFYLKYIELFDYKDKKISSLSKGMQQKIQFISTIMFEPKIIILDEPFSGLDPINIKLLKTIIADLKTQNRTIILSTHQMNMVEELCDVILILNQGKKIIYGPVNHIRESYSENEYITKSDADYSKIDVIDKIFNEEEDLKHILIRKNSRPNELIEALIAQGASIEHFEKRLMPLEDLFIKLVREDDNK